MRAIYQCGESNPCGWKVELSEDNAELKQRIAALEAQVEAAHRAIDSIGLSRCADAHAGVYPDGRITCDDGRPPLSLVDRVEWLIRWLSDDPYPMGPRIKALEAENAALKAELASANERRVAWEMNAQQSAHAWAQAQERIAALKAAQDDAARLRAALQAVEFTSDDICTYCLWCKANDKELALGEPIQHAPDCARQAALAQTQEVKA